MTYPRGRKCRTCGTSLDGRDHAGRRKFCSQKCAGVAARKPDAELRYSAAHRRARALVAAGPCTKCDKPGASDVHHRDGNHNNNDPKNLVRLCRSCHIKEHRQRAACIECGAPAHARSLCNIHYLARRRAGTLPPRTQPRASGGNPLTPPARG